MGMPNVYPMGVTVYQPDKAWSGYTLLPVQGVGAVLIDMNGNVMKTWKDLQGFPNKLLPDGQIFGALGMRDHEYGYQDMTDLVQVDWEGNIVWKFNTKEQVDDNGTTEWMARQHHDFQREGNPVGYYTPELVCKTDSGHTFLLCHEDIYNKRISDKRLLDDCIIEVDWEGNIVWQWRANEHFNEFGFDEYSKNVLARNPNYLPNGGGQGDWLHINSMSLLGPNQWYESGDERFHPDNMIINSREANIIAIISKETGKIVWSIGPDFTKTKLLKRIGQMIGAHHAHMIPKGLPGAGNILVFDNGGWAGYGLPSRTSKDGTKADKRDYSRILEINPVTLELVWQFTGSEWGGMSAISANTKFYSQLISSAQRLPNGNTLITEGCFCRIFELTKDKELVWEYYAPFTFSKPMIYRAYRYPYDYVPQLLTPKEIAVQPPDNQTFRVPGSALGQLEPDKMVCVAGTKGYGKKMDDCVTDDSLK